VKKKSNKCKLVPIRAECNNGVYKYNIILYGYLDYNIYPIDKRVLAAAAVSARSARRPPSVYLVFAHSSRVPTRSNARTPIGENDKNANGNNYYYNNIVVTLLLYCSETACASANTTGGPGARFRTIDVFGIIIIISLLYRRRSRSRFTHTKAYEKFLRGSADTMQSLLLLYE